MDERAEKLARQLALAEKTLFALEAYLAQARQVLANTRGILSGEADPGGAPPAQPTAPAE